MIRINGAAARVESYSQNWHTVRDFAGRSHDIIHGGRYLDKFEKRGDDWRVIDRVVIVDWVLEKPNTVDLSKPTPGLLGCDSNPIGGWYPDDPLYSFLGSLAPSVAVFESHA